MNCRDADRLITDLLDAKEHPRTQAVGEHLESCPECRLRFEQDQQAFEAIRPLERIVASHHFKEGAMRAIIAEAERESSTSERRSIWRHWPKWAAAMGAAAVVFIALGLLPIGPWGHSNAAGVTLLAQSAQAMSDLQTVHMIGRVRTLPGDNFEFIGTEYSWVPLEVWREYSDPPRWRIEKPGRVVVMNGQSSTMYIPAANEAATGTPQAGFVEWLRPLLSPETIIQQELQVARAGGSVAQLSESDGAPILNVQRKASGNFANDWVRNRTIPESDHTCVYRFDEATKRLEGLQVIVHTGDGDVPVLELTTVRYNEAFSPDLFSLQLPADVNFVVNPENLKPATAQLNGPNEAASYFFDALARKDWNAVLEVYPLTRVDDKVKQNYGGLQIVSIGEPFQSGLYRGFFVPYEVRLPNGSVKKWKLAVRNDNPAGRWLVDGGF